MLALNHNSFNLTKTKIYCIFSDYNIVSSPLESEVVEEYQLFPCVADYVDDGERHTIESPTEDDSKSITMGN